MPKRIIKTDKAPAAIGPYSQAVISGDLVFTSGQIPLDPSSGELCEGDIEAQTHQVMKNLSVVLDAAGVDFGAVVKTTIYLTTGESVTLDTFAPAIPSPGSWAIFGVGGLAVVRRRRR